MVTESHPSEAHPETDAQVPAEAGSVEAAVAVSEVDAQSVHESLLETVSPDALATATGQPLAKAPGTTDTADVPEPAPAMQPPEALEAAPDAVPDFAPEPEAVPAVEMVQTPIRAADIETASVALSVQATPQAILHPTGISFDMIGEITHVNATILAFLQSEGSAAVAHWQSLSGARTPADAIRIQVDEMQRAADASLTCFSVLARRAGRLATGIGRA